MTTENENATVVMRQYSQDGRVTTGDMYAEQDADAVAWFTVDGCVWLAVKRTPRGRWQIETSDFAQFAVSNYDKRFGSPDEAFGWANTRAGTDPVEVEGWDTELVSG